MREEEGRVLGRRGKEEVGLQSGHGGLTRLCILHVDPWGPRPELRSSEV